MRRLFLIVSVLMSSLAYSNELSVITAEGFGFADASRFSEPQARLMALRAAKIDAQRNLLEVINGVRVTAGTTVKDMMLESDIIGTRVKGMLQGSFETASTVTREDGSWVAAVTMAVCLDKSDAICEAKPSLAGITQPSLKGAPPEARFTEADLTIVKEMLSASEEEGESTEQPKAAATPVADDAERIATKPDTMSTVGAETNTGLILDASGLNYTPMLDVRVRTRSGKELYGPGHVAMGSDWLHWSSSLEDARRMSQVVGAAPLIIIPVSLGEATELVISDQDAISLFTSNTRSGDFLAAGKVVIIVAGS